MKTCKKCGETKPLDQFHDDKSKPGGKRAECKPCKNAQNRAYQKSEAGKVAHHNATQRYRHKHAKKRKAHIIVNNALRDKKLTRQPCETCGSVDHVVAHHDDYDQPLAIRWLCEDHHKEWHKIHGEAANPS